VGWANDRLGGWVIRDTRVATWAFAQRQTTQAATLLQISVLSSPLTMTMQNSYNERLKKRMREDKSKDVRQSRHF
jgi:hypothetical protein